MQTYFIGKDRTKIQLQNTDFLAQGGQAKIFAKWNNVYKIYHDPKTLIPDAKLKELEVLRDIPEVILPKETIYDSKDRRVGFVFDWIKDAEPIYNMGSNSYWMDKGITPEKATKIIEKIFQTVQKIHERHCLIVDLNPFNILIDQKTLSVHFFIDTEPWQTKNFKATVIMPGIRDWQTKDFSELSDWYSIAIVSCEFYLGVHPFKGGVHPRFGPKDMELRMKHNAPIFDSGVRLNSRIRPFDVIPKNYLSWYIDLFQNGKRSLPPTVAGTAAIKKPAAVVTKAVKFEITLLQEYDEPIVSHCYRDGRRVIRTASYTSADRKRFDKIGEVIFITGKPILAQVQDYRLRLFGETEIAHDFIAESILIAENKCYVKNGAYLHEVVITEFGEKLVPSIGQSWDIMPNAAKLFDGIVIQNMLGKPFFVIPGICKIGVKELEGHRVINAKRSGRLVIVMANKQGQDYQLVFWFNKQFDGYVCQAESVIGVDINAAMLDKSVIVTIPEDGKIVLKSEQQSVVIEDASLQTAWNLSAEGNNVVFFVENKLYQLKMVK